MAAAMTSGSAPAELYFAWVHFHEVMIDQLMLLDSGAQMSVIPLYIFAALPLCDRPVVRPEPFPITAGNGTKVHSLGVVTLEIKLQNVVVKQIFHVCGNTTQPVLGKDFLNAHNATVQHGSHSRMFLEGEEIDIFTAHGQKIHHRAVLTQACNIPPGRRAVCQAKVEGRGNIEGRVVLLEPARLLAAKAFVLAPKVITTVRHGYVTTEIFNPGDETMRVPKGTTVGVLLGTESAQQWDVPLKQSATPTAAAEAARLNHLQAGPPSTLPEHLQTMYEKNRDGLNDEEDKAFGALLTEFEDIFATNSYDLGKCNIEKHHIDTGDERPVKHQTRRPPQSQNEETKRQVTALHKAEIIRPSKSPWGSNVLLVKKKDGTWRMCVDYRELNQKTKNGDPYLLPRIDETIDSLGDAKYFCTLDLIQGYHQIELTESSKPKTAFVVPRMIPSHWEYNYMPFGVQGGPSTFQRVMDTLLQGIDQKIAMAYLDDIIVSGATPMECVRNLRLVFIRLRAADLKLKPKKCEFFRSELLYLGHIVSGDGIRCDPAKVEAVQQWIAPRTCKQVRQFLGTVNYYHRFIKSFAHIANPLFAISNKKHAFKWSEECHLAFELLKVKLTEAPIMAYPRERGRFILDTDASAYAIGAVLSQEQPSGDPRTCEKVIAYGSRTLKKCERRYCTRRREMLAIIYFVKQFKAYLYGREVLIRTDHASLKYIKQLRDPSEQFMRWIERLEEMQYTIEIRAGRLHCNADGLSRLPPCGGKRCICEGVDVMEESGEIVDDYTYLSPAFDDGEELLDAEYEALVSAADAPLIRLRPDDYDSDESDADKAEEDAGLADGEIPSEPLAPVLGRFNCYTSGPRRSPRKRLTQPIVRYGQQGHLSDEWVRENAFTFQQLWTKEEMAAEQGRDPDIAMIYKRKVNGEEKPPWEAVSGGSPALCSYWLEWNRLSIEDGMLYRRWENREGTEVNMQLLLPFKYQDEMAKQFHDAPSAAHMGRRRTHTQVQKRAFWYRMAADLKQWIRSCDVCQRRKRPGRTPHAPQRTYTAGTPNLRVSMDICGPLVQTERGNTHILVITDQYSRYTRAFALGSTDAETIAEVFERGWITQLGAPREIHSDQGTNFGSKLFKEVCKVYRGVKTRTTAYHPQSDGMVERFNQTMAAMLHALCGEEPHSWDQQLMYVCQAYNATKHAATGVEPNKLIYTYPVYFPWDAMIPQPPCDPDVTPPLYVKNMQRRMRRIHQLAREKIGHSADIQKRYSDRALSMNNYKTGDTVMLKNYVYQSGIKKLQDRYLGPFHMINCIGGNSSTYRIARAEGMKPEIVHHDRLKPYIKRADDRPSNNDWVHELAKRFTHGNSTSEIGTQTDGEPAGGDGDEAPIHNVHVTPPTSANERAGRVSQGHVRSLETINEEGASVASHEIKSFQPLNDDDDDACDYEAEATDYTTPDVWPFNDKAARPPGDTSLVNAPTSDDTDTYALSSLYELTSARKTVKVTVPEESDPRQPQHRRPGRPRRDTSRTSPGTSPSTSRTSPGASYDTSRTSPSTSTVSTLAPVALRTLPSTSHDTSPGTSYDTPGTSALSTLAPVVLCTLPSTSYDTSRTSPSTSALSTLAPVVLRTLPSTSYDTSRTSPGTSYDTSRTSPSASESDTAAQVASDTLPSVSCVESRTSTSTSAPRSSEQDTSRVPSHTSANASATTHTSTRQGTSRATNKQHTTKQTRGGVLAVRQYKIDGGRLREHTTYTTRSTQTRSNQSIVTNAKRSTKL